MANYYVTFRIHDQKVDGKTYADRYDALMTNIRADGLGFWTDTTSFLMVESNLDTDTFSQNAVQGLSARYDLVLITDPADNSACCFGNVEHFDVLKSFLPNIKKLG